MHDNPYESPETPEASIEHPQSAPNLRIFGYVIGAVVILGLLIALMLPVSRGSGHRAARSNACINNMRQITLAILSYESEHGTLPPAYTVDEEGNRLHSWRTLILPYMDEQALYDSIDLTKPWDHPDNAAAHETSIYHFSCPGGTWGEDSKTTYLAVNGPRCYFNGSMPRSLAEIKDGLSKTMMIVEVDEDNAVHWMSPEDADEEMVTNLNPESRTSHNGIVLTAYGDGAVRSMVLDDDPQRRRAMLTIDGGEDFEFE